MDRDGVFVARPDAAGVATKPSTGAGSALPTVRDERLTTEPPVKGQRLDPIDLAVLTQLLALDPERIGSVSPDLQLRIDERLGYQLRSRELGWQASFGHYTPTLFGPDLDPPPGPVPDHARGGARGPPRERRGSCRPRRRAARTPSTTATAEGRQRRGRASPTIPLATRRAGAAVGSVVGPGEGKHLEIEAILVALDVGTSKVAVLVGEVTNEGALDIIGKGTVPSSGLRKGLVNNIDQTVDTIHQAIEQAERLSGLRLEAAFVAVGGDHVESLNSRGTVAVSGAHREVTHEDIERATEVARAVTIPSNREVLHVLPRDFTVDGQEGVKDPAGMSAIRLEVTAHIVHGSATALQNLTKCVRQAGMRPDELVVSSIASGEAVLSETERELGVAIADIGAGTTDIALVRGGLAVPHVGRAARWGERHERHRDRHAHEPGRRGAAEDPLRLGRSAGSRWPPATSPSRSSTTASPARRGRPTSPRSSRRGCASCSRRSARSSRRQATPTGCPPASS